MTATSENSPEFYEKIRKACEKLLNRESQEALELIDELQREHPNAPENLFALGLAAVTMGEYGRALMFMEAAHQQDPECFEYAEVLANLHVRVGNLAEGVYFAKLSTILDPHPFIYNLIPADLSNFFESLDNASIPRHYAYGYVKMQQHEYVNAAREFERQVILVPDDADALRESARAHLQLGNFERAISDIQKSLKSADDKDTSHFRAGQISKRIGAKDAALFHLKRALELEPDSLGMAAACYALAGALGKPDAEELAFIQSEMERRAGDTEELPPEASSPAYRKERIHVGYVVNDTWNADAAALLGPILEHHDREKFDVFLYQTTQGRSAFIQQFNNAVDTERRLWELDDETAAVVISGDEIDILVNCSQPELNNRASLFAMHPASIQIALTGMNYGSKIPGIDHVIGDAMIETPLKSALGQNQEMSILRSGLWSTRPSFMLLDINPSPAKTNGHVTFGAACDCEALTPETVDAFVKALEAVPGSRLIFGAAGHTDTYPRRVIDELFSAAGMGDRVSVFDENPIGEPWVPDPSYWHEIDMFLVPGALTSPLRASDALWMGVPVLTIPGETPASCAATSILAASTHLQWSQKSVEDWLAKIAGIAGDLDALAETRETLRGTVRSTALFNPVAHVRELEGIYTRLVDERVES